MGFSSVTPGAPSAPLSASKQRPGQLSSIHPAPRSSKLRCRAIQPELLSSTMQAAAAVGGQVAGVGQGLGGYEAGLAAAQGEAYGALAQAANLVGEVALFEALLPPWLITLLSIPGAIGIGVGLVVGLGRLVIYARKEGLIASQLATYCKPESVILQVGGNNRYVYYYPEITTRVTAIGRNLKQKLWYQTGLQTGIPCSVMIQDPSTFPKIQKNSVDCICVYDAFHEISDIARFLEEAGRVLRKNGFVFFYQRVNGKDVQQGLSVLLGNPSKAIGMKRLTGALKKSYLLGQGKADLIFQSQDPHLYGVAFKDKDEFSKSRSFNQSRKEWKKMKGDEVAEQERVLVQAADPAEEMQKEKQRQKELQKEQLAAVKPKDKGQKELQKEQVAAAKPKGKGKKRSKKSGFAGTPN